MYIDMKTKNRRIKRYPLKAYLDLAIGNKAWHSEAWPMKNGSTKLIEFNGNKR